jgi:A49-like RNA polymerase I associated factor
VALQQSVPRYTPPERGQVEDRAGLETAAAQRQALYQDFGSAKKRRALKSQEANRVDVSTVVGSAGGGTSSGPEAWSTTALSASNRQAVDQWQEQQARIAQASNDGTSAAAASNNAKQQALVATTDEWRRSILPSFVSTAVTAREFYPPEQTAGSALWALVSGKLKDAKEAFSSNRESEFTLPRRKNLNLEEQMQYLIRCLRSPLLPRHPLEHNGQVF